MSSLIDSLDPSAKKIIQRRKTSGSGPPVTFSSREQLALALSSAEPTPLKKVTPKTSRLSLRPQSSSSSLLSSTSSASDSAVSSTPQQRRLSRQASAMSGVSSNRNTTGNNGSSTNSSPSDTTFEDGILDLLKSLDSAKHFEGLQALSQAATLGKISACNRGYMLERLADVLPSVILGSGNNNSVSNPALITLFLDVSFLDAILAANLVTREVILSCLFNLMIDKQGGGSGANNNNNEHPSSISRKCAAYVDHLKATLSKPLLLDSLIKTLTEFKNTRAGGIAAARERERVWQETVLGLISDISSSEPGSQLDAELMDFFSGGGGEGSQRVRHLMLRMVPILERRTTNVLETTIYTLFSRLYRYNSALFRKTLNTFDIDTAEKVYERLGVSSTDCEVAASSIVSTLIPDIAMAAEPFRKENVVSAAEEFGRQSTLQFSADVASSAVDVGLLLEDETEPEDFADTSIMHSNAAPSTNTASTSGYNNVIHTNDKKMLMVDYDKDEEFVEGRQDNSPPSSISSQIQSNAINMLDFVSEWSTPVKKNGMFLESLIS